jgi:AcrR family transcriptional regulator
VSQAVRRLLVERGYAAMSIEQVAAAAKVPKTAIYRRWASKAEMVFALVIHPETIERPADQGTLAADLRVLIERIVALLSAPAARQALPGLLADLRRDPSLAERFQASFIEAEKQLVRALLDRAVRRGELAKEPDPADVHAQLLGTVFAWLYLLAAEPPADLADRVRSSVLATLQK